MPLIYEQYMKTGEDTHNLYQIYLVRNKDRLYLRFKGFYHEYDSFRSKDRYYERKELPKFKSTSISIVDYDIKKLTILDQTIERLNEYLISNGLETIETIGGAIFKNYLKK